MADPFTNEFSRRIHRQRYSFDGLEDWEGTTSRVIHSVVEGSVPAALTSGELAELSQRMYDRKFIPAGRYLYAAGRSFHQVNNCYLLRAHDSRQGWAETLKDAVEMLMTGGGIGVDYSGIRPDGYPISSSRGHATGPLSVMHMVNEAGRYVMQGGQRRSAIWAGLGWFHPDVQDFLKVKDWDPRVREIKATDFNFPAEMELTNISVVYDDIFFGLLDGTITNEDAHANLAWRYDWYELVPSIKERDLQAWARQVWADNCLQAFSTAEPGMSINFRNWRESLRNACTEVTSEDDGDKCNLGTVWMQAHESLSDFRRTVHLATKFLMLGSIYSDLPNEKVHRVGHQNNRIGLGLGGMAEWLMDRGERYEVTPEMHEWLRVYQQESDETAAAFAKKLGVNEPKGKRAIAPTGTIGIIAETTTGIEPLFCAAYLRRYNDTSELKKGRDKAVKGEVVVDGAVKRLLAKGIKPSEIYDAYSLSFEERVRFQADVQDYVDMAISSTCNMPSWGSTMNNEDTVAKRAETLLQYAPRLRGFTCYPDGARGGQPLTPMYLEVALEDEGKVYEMTEQECVNGVCGL